MTVFIDESGKDGPPVFVMAGFVARAEQWEQFNIEWQRVLDEPPAIRSFHMVEAYESRFDVKRPRLYEIIRKHTMASFVLTVDHEDYEAVVRGLISRRIDRIYYFMFMQMWEIATTWQQKNDLNEKMDFILDKAREESDYLVASHTNMVKMSHPDVRARIGGRPRWEDDKDFLGLQAADILAWTFRRFAFLNKRNEHLPADMKEFLDGIRIKRRNFTRNDLQKFVTSGLRKNIDLGKLTEYQTEEVLANSDIIIQEENRSRFLAAKPGDVIQLTAFPAKQMKRFRLVRSCAKCDSPHLHRRVGEECLGGE